MSGHAKHHSIELREGWTEFGDLRNRFNHPKIEPSLLSPQINRRSTNRRRAGKSSGGRNRQQKRRGKNMTRDGLDLPLGVAQEYNTVRSDGHVVPDVVRTSFEVAPRNTRSKQLSFFIASKQEVARTVDTPASLNSSDSLAMPPARNARSRPSLLPAQPQRQAPPQPEVDTQVRQARQAPQAPQARQAPQAPQAPHANRPAPEATRSLVQHLEAAKKPELRSLRAAQSMRSRPSMRSVHSKKLMPKSSMKSVKSLTMKPSMKPSMKAMKSMQAMQSMKAMQAKGSIRSARSMRALHSMASMKSLRSTSSLHHKIVQNKSQLHTLGAALAARKQSTRVLQHEEQHEPLPPSTLDAELEMLGIEEVEEVEIEEHPPQQQQQQPRQPPPPQRNTTNTVLTTTTIALPSATPSPSEPPAPSRQAPPLPTPIEFKTQKNKLKHRKPPPKRFTARGTTLRRQKKQLKHRAPPPKRFTAPRATPATPATPATHRHHDKPPPRRFTSTAHMHHMSDSIRSRKTKQHRRNHTHPGNQPAPHRQPPPKRFTAPPTVNTAERDHHRAQTRKGRTESGGESGREKSGGDGPPGMSSGPPGMSSGPPARTPPPPTYSPAHRNNESVGRQGKALFQVAHMGQKVLVGSITF